MTGSTLCLSSHTIPGAVILGQWVGHIWHCQLGLFCVVWGFLACGFTVGKGNSSSGEAGRRGQRGEMQWEFL